MTFPSTLCALKGSSPRVWGQVARIVESSSYSRIIPTRVGTRAYHETSLSSQWDHPHACGDKEDEPTDDELKEGSSPRVWGQAVNFGFNAPELRIIPTRVGTSRDTEVRYINTEDHPHACGDKTVGLLVTHSHLGSSPRVWGQDLQ